MTTRDDIAAVLDAVTITDADWWNMLPETRAVIEAAAAEADYRNGAYVSHELTEALATWLAKAKTLTP